jgi:hypothetical protein
MSVDAAAKEVDALKQERQAVVAAPRPSSEAKAIARKQILAIAEAGQPNVAGTITYGESVKLPRQTVVVNHSGLVVANSDGSPSSLRGRATFEQVDASALLFWLNRDAIIAAIENEIDEQSVDSAALDDATRAKRLADVDTRILDAERAYVAAVDASGGSYRENTGVRAILNITGPAPRET